MIRDYRTLKIDRRGGVDWVTLNRPESLNALDEIMIGELRAFFEQAAGHSDARVIVLRGAGRGFCSGLDMPDIARRLDALGTAGIYGVQRSLSRIIVAMRRCPQPIVALVHGPASGGGFALALASDIRICSSDARMNAAFIRIGLSGCDVGVSYLLPRLVGASVASELLMTGRVLDATRAEKIGLVSAIVEVEALADVGAAMTRDLMAASPLGLALTKQGLEASLGAGSLEAALELEDRQQALLCHAPEFSAALQAFLRRR
jgi:enoyl-CoA hydratase/carnithine racemase